MEDSYNIIKYSSSKSSTAEKTSLLISFTALHEFSERADGELSFLSGDVLEVGPQTSLLEEKGFIYLFNPRTGKSGWAPSSYLTKTDSSNPFSLPFYFDVNRRKAEVMLMRPDVGSGTYLLRPCGDDRLQQEDCASNSNTGVRSFALSVRMNDQRGLPLIKHYKIEGASSSYYIYRKRTFENIAQLVKFYSNVEAPGIGRLTRPYARQLSAPVPLSHLSIPKDEVRLVERLGNGNFGLVWKGRWKSLSVAVKMSRRSSDTEQTADEEHAMFLAEATSMSSLSHDNLVKLIAVSLERKPYWIITELMNRGSLRDFLQSKQGRQEVSFYDMIDFMHQISCGMEYLVDKMRFCHRDLRAANVMVNRDSNNETTPYELKIGDFGLAKLLEDVTPKGLNYEATIDANKSTRLPVKWTPPEALLYRRFSTKSDVWSFGIVCYEIVTFCKMPYKGKSTQQTIDFVECGGRIALDECQSDEPPVVQCPQELYRIMLACWRQDPEKRPMFQLLKLTFENYMQSGHWSFDESKNKNLAE